MTAPDKPVAMWVLQILLVPLALVSILNIFGLPLGPSTSARISWIAFWLALSSWSAAVLVTMALRKPLARWLGGATIALLTFVGVYGLVLRPQSPSPAAWLGALAAIAVGAYWLHAFALSYKARRYFGLI